MDNPCGCKVVGPTLGAVLGLVTAVVAYPMAAVTFCVDRYMSRRFMRAPVNMYIGTKSAIPI